MSETKFNDEFLNLCEKHISQAKSLTREPKKFKNEVEKLNRLIEEKWSLIFNENATASITKTQKKQIEKIISDLKSLEEIAKSLGTWLDGFENFMENFSKRSSLGKK